MKFKKENEKKKEGIVNFRISKEIHHDQNEQYNEQQNENFQRNTMLFVPKVTSVMLHIQVNIVKYLIEVPSVMLLEVIEF